MLAIEYGAALGMMKISKIDWVMLHIHKFVLKPLHCILLRIVGKKIMKSKRRWIIIPLLDRTQ